MATRAQANTLRLTTHGMSQSREYRIWSLMRNRCENENATNFSYYGGRGISVNPEWMRFERFFADMGSAPTGYTLDRIDSDGNYCKENCRWASKTEQANNRSSNRILSHKGKSLTLSQWAREVGIKIGTLHKRLKDGWSIERALFTPIANYVRASAPASMGDRA